MAKNKKALLLELEEVEEEIRKVKEELRKVKLPKLKKLLIGRQCCIKCRGGSHYFTLIGNIKRVYFSDKWEVLLKVSSKEINGEKIKGMIIEVIIRYRDGKWSLFKIRFQKKS